MSEEKDLDLTKKTNDALVGLLELQARSFRGIQRDSQAKIEALKKERKDLIDYIEKLKKESFEGWTEDAKNGYLTAITSVVEFLKKSDHGT